MMIDIPRRILSVTALVVTMTASSFSPAQGETIEWWQFWTDPNIKPVIESMVADFEKENPEIDVKLTDLTWSNGHEKIVLALASGTGPDVLELGSDWIAQFADYGHLASLAGQLGEDSAGYDGWSMAAYQGDVYARPWFLGTRVLFLNRELMNKTGFRPNYLPTQWLQLSEIAKRAHALSDEIFGWGSNTPEKHRLYKKFLPFFWSNKAQILTDDGKYCVISSTKAVEALNFYKTLHDGYGFVANQREIEDAFLEGKIAAIISGDWLLKRIHKEGIKFKLATTHIPGPDFLGRSFMGGEFLAINSASDNKVAAAKFIRHITSPENQVKFCKANRTANPSSKVAQKDSFFADDEHMMTFIRQLRSSNHPPVDPAWVEMEDAIEAAVEDALFGSGQVATALREAQIKITQARSK